MPIPFGSLHTPGGYLNGEVASALQKEIRRGKEKEALFWATELELGGHASYVWKRLLIIASEDVGIADSSVALIVRALYENWQEMRGKVKGDKHAGFHRVFIAHAVCLLARAPKSRMLDHALMVMYSGERPTPPMPDYALDKHTAAGIKKGRGLEHFFEVGAKLENVSEIPDPYAVEARVRHIAAAQQRERERTHLSAAGREEMDVAQLELLDE